MRITELKYFWQGKDILALYQVSLRFFKEVFLELDEFRRKWNFFIINNDNLFFAFVFFTERSSLPFFFETKEGQSK